MMLYKALFGVLAAISSHCYAITIYSNNNAEPICRDVTGVTLTPSQIDIAGTCCSDCTGAYEGPSLLMDDPYTYPEAVDEGGSAVPVEISGVAKIPAYLEIVSLSPPNHGTASVSGTSLIYQPPVSGTIGVDDNNNAEASTVTVGYKLVDADEMFIEGAVDFIVNETFVPEGECSTTSILECLNITLKAGGDSRSLNPGVTYAYEFYYEGQTGFFNWVSGGQKEVTISASAGDPSGVLPADREITCKSTTREGSLYYGPSSLSDTSYMCRLEMNTVYYLNVQTTNTTTQDYITLSSF